ncbi:hypothetical protein KOI35_44550 [Actinoplanes bogorensis]|uniref:Uncharacterized protein n=1 Tax=Paractinoplanes bogorensis TaxID=1610840 RepID=A0ABS5Z6P7_9ACTN|nr:hypothetical protein [Actinoplanes bogorensis]MBU2670594.1 hypothetical protein [Actinoplanes bogorensis]
MRWSRRTPDRLAAIDAYRFPVSVRQRLAADNSTLTSADLDRIEAAARQWFRLAARHPKAELTMPSRITAALWLELARRQTDYATFCAEAFGHIFVPPPDTPGSTAGPAGRRYPALGETFRRAREDENCDPAQLPLLFRIDQELAVPQGNRYLADCGGRGICHDLPGALCLMHVTGTGRTRRFNGPFGPPPATGYEPGGLSCSGGCGSG